MQPSTHKTKPEVRIEDWSLDQNDALIGRVFGHPNIRDGKHITTAKIITIDEKSGVAHTRDIKYLLGTPWSPNGAA